PTCGRLELGEGLAGLVEGTDVAQLHDFPLVLLVPAQRQPLGAAHVGAMGVDATAAGTVEKGAASDRMGRRVENFAAVSANAVGLDLEDLEVVDAAGRTAFVTPKARGVAGFERRG